MYLEDCSKVLQKIDHFYRDRIFIINICVKLDNGIYYYWLKANNRKVKGHFAREELFALSDQFS